MQTQNERCKCENFLSESGEKPALGWRPSRVSSGTNLWTLQSSGLHKPRSSKVQQNLGHAADRKTNWIPQKNVVHRLRRKSGEHEII